MNHGREVVVMSAARTAIGRYGGSLKDTPVSDLAVLVTREAMKRAGVQPNEIQHVVFGNVMQTDLKDIYLARVAGVKSGIPVEVPALTLNRLCGSGLEAVTVAAQMIALGEIDIAVAGGSECMSRGQYWLPSMRWGQRLMSTQVIDAMNDALLDPFEGQHMAITAENLAKKYNISRQEQDEFALLSQQRAAQAIKDCVFKDEILPVELKNKAGTKVFDTDEHPRPDTTMEGLSKLKPAFSKDGTVTAGNASGINDGAAALVVMAREVAEKRGMRPLARLAHYTHAAVDPNYMGYGPVPAVRKLLEQTKMSYSDIDVIELNEAFAAQALACIKELKLPMDKTNPHGGAIALGHPVGATGAIIATKALYDLKHTNRKRAIVTMCIGGGQGMAALFEAMN
jgi:acetyl-CoA C-acetyltransferase